MTLVCLMASRWTHTATYSAPGQAVCGCAAPMGNCWGVLSCQSYPRTWPEARMGASSSSPRAPVSTDCQPRHVAYDWSNQQACQAAVDNARLERMVWPVSGAQVNTLSVLSMLIRR